MLRDITTEDIRYRSPQVGEILGRIRTGTWPLKPEVLATLGMRAFFFENDPPKLEAREYSGDDWSDTPAAARLGLQRSTGSVAVVPIIGVIDQRRSWFGDVFTSELSPMLDSLVRNEAIGAIVLDVDSPGGSVAGVPELADQIRGYRGQKPIYATSNTTMASAAYWIASGAEKVFVSPSGEAGSIGVWTAHLDVSAMLEKYGQKVTLISAGKYKVEGNPFEPLSDEAKAAIQADVDTYFGMFVDAVAKSRGRRSDTVRNGFGEGRMLTAERAVEEGLADGVATLGDLLGAIVPRRRQGTSTAAARLAIEREM